MPTFLRLFQILQTDFKRLAIVLEFAVQLARHIGSLQTTAGQTEINDPGCV